MNTRQFTTHRPGPWRMAPWMFPVGSNIMDPGGTVRLSADAIESAEALIHTLTQECPAQITALVLKGLRAFYGQESPPTYSVVKYSGVETSPFRAGEILKLDSSDRDQFGRKPHKWHVTFEGEEEQ